MPGSATSTTLHRPWLARLRRALAGDRFVLHFQPIVSLREQRVVHHEALLRLLPDGDDHDGAAGGQPILPGAFLPAAERTGLICEIDRMVIGKVAAMLGRDRAAGAGIAVNVSARSVSDTGLLAHLQRCLAVHHADPRRLVVEVTETAAISDMARARGFCLGAQALGCRVALDDFGAGHGSLQYLRHLPFDYLKIDGQFVRALPASRADRLVVEALAGIAWGLGAEPIAEFVEAKDTLRALRALGLDLVQGFAVGRPAPALPVAA
jgi:EAL domain-containing protein (putative c-di-GMP-specific phosphodiesterase class I)